MTYSIVARDAETGELGVAVQSHYFSTGSIVTWAQPGVGAVATQSFAEPSYGPLGLQLMSADKNAEAALKGLLAVDEGAPTRQVAMVDAANHVAAHTGASCIAEAGHRTGDGYSVQANMMLRATVWDAMAEAYEARSGDLAARLLAALDAAEAEGGDVRGRQSAALLVVPANGPPWAKHIEVRVEDHAEPLVELRRLVDLKRAYLSGDPVNSELRFWHALRLASDGKEDEARALLAELNGEHAGWGELLRRLPAAGLITDPTLVDRLLG